MVRKNKYFSSLQKQFVNNENYPKLDQFSFWGSQINVTWCVYRSSYWGCIVDNDYVEVQTRRDPSLHPPQKLVVWWTHLLHFFWSDVTTHFKCLTSQWSFLIVEFDEEKFSIFGLTILNVIYSCYKFLYLFFFFLSSPVFALSFLIISR